MEQHLLEVQELHTSFFTHMGEVQAVRGVSFYVDQGEVIGVIGESGCGKSVTALSIMGLLSKQGRVTDGEVRFKGENLLSLPRKDRARMRGKHIAMIFQDSMTSLDPVFTVGDQMSEVLRYHTGIGKEEALARCIEMLGLVGIQEPEKWISAYPHELSGGMRQRVTTALALSCEPELLLADEPTTALDVTVQAQILELMKDLTNRLGTAVILITHDLGVVANTCSRVLVMYGGQVVEEGSVETIFAEPQHPYTQGLLKTILDLNTGQGKKLFCIDGLPPQLLCPPKGCAFASRCPRAMKVCLEQMPDFYGDDIHKARCWLLDPECPVKGENPW